MSSIIKVHGTTGLRAAKSSRIRQAHGISESLAAAASHELWRWASKQP